MADHTPGPWKAFIINGQVVVVPLAPPYSSDVPLATMNTPFSWWGSGNTYSDKDIRKLHIANAKFITRACNSHYDLLAALEGLVDAIGADLEEYYPIAYDKVKAALAKAKV